ncbi:MAG: peptidase MA family metallohydrolase [Anaerolineae bacterium]|jgi:hypothetical protein|nr:hypothetical protein [Chloroflexota bacterium]
MRWRARSPLARSGRACLLLALLASVVLTTGAGSVGAQAGWQVLESGASAEFAQSLNAAVRVSAPTPITRADLFFGRVGDRLVRRVYVPVSTGTTVSVDHGEVLEPGQYAPGTELRLWWRLTDRTGATFDTPEQVIRYDDEAHPWESVSERGVTLYYYGVRPGRAQGWLDNAHTALGRIEKELGLSAEAPIDIYVYRSERDMQGAVATRSDDYDAMVTTLGVAVDEDTLILLGSHSDMEETMAHELSHIIVGMATENPYAGLPRWLDEGLAMLAEGKLPRENAAALQRAIETDRLLSVRSMTSYSGQASEVNLFYGECYSVVSFMLENYGRERMQALLEVFSKGASQHDALREVYDITIEELDALWRESLGVPPRPAPQAPDSADALSGGH